jgi:hypothetical protein
MSFHNLYGFTITVLPAIGVTILVAIGATLFVKPRPPPTRKEQYRHAFKQLLLDMNEIIKLGEPMRDDSIRNWLFSCVENCNGFNRDQAFRGASLREVHEIGCILGGMLRVVEEERLPEYEDDVEPPAYGEVVGEHEAVRYTRSLSSEEMRQRIIDAVRGLIWA